MKQKIVVDTNIIFSAILNPGSRIGKLLLNSKHHFQFYTCNFLKTELFKHRDKLLRLAKLNSRELDELEFLVSKNIIFINESLLPEEVVLATENILASIDINDTLFVALARHLNAKLWTGDKELVTGLTSSVFIETMLTNQLSDLLDKLES